jgi:OOP family OmpA-OmpF porin
LDGDKDGVPDGVDRCPGTPVGCVVDAAGCSVDSDNDGVCDGLDKCPNTPRGKAVDLTGCEFVLPTPEKPLVLEGVHFETGKALLTEDSKQILSRVAASLLNHPEVKLEVAGHTDATGSDAHNLKLSQARANAVRNYLVGKGVPAERLVAQGYGESQPIADNQTKEGRDRNRRTELRRLP